MNRTDDLISRKQAIKEILAFCPEETKPGSLDEYGVAVLSGIIEVVLKRLPAADAVPVVYGNWEPSSDFNGYCRCSICHDAYIGSDWLVGGKWSYCPHCGAKMEENNNNE